MGVAITVNGPLVRFFWRVFDLVAYWLTLARFWLVDAVYGP
jgi:hypothetical protein